MLFIPICKQYRGVIPSSETGLGAAFPFRRAKMWALWRTVPILQSTICCFHGPLLKVLPACVVPSASNTVWSGLVVNCQLPPFLNRNTESDLESALFVRKMLLSVSRTKATLVAPPGAGGSLLEPSMASTGYHVLNRPSTYSCFPYSGPLGESASFPRLCPWPGAKSCKLLNGLSRL